MEHTISIILAVEAVITFLCYGLIGFINLWIYYSESNEKFPLFPILNPFSFASYELMFSSMFTFVWKEEKPNLKLKRTINKTTKIFVLLILTIVITIILNVIFF